MTEYWKNLILALTGNNPYRQELDETKRHYQQASDNVSSLRLMNNYLVERWDAAEKQASSLRKLVENLRGRISEKDAAMEQQDRSFRELLERTKADYQKRIDEYNREINELRS